MKNEISFERIESYYLDHSISYERCSAFRKALDFVRKQDFEKYKEIVISGFEESFDYGFLDDEEED